MWSKIINNDMELAIFLYLKGETVEVVDFNSATVKGLEELSLYEIKSCAKNKDCMFFTNGKTANK